MSKSNLDIMEEWGCASCLYLDKLRFNAMKVDPAVELMAGWCTYPFRIKYSEDFTKCLMHKVDGDEPTQDDGALIEMKRRQGEL